MNSTLPAPVAPSLEPWTNKVFPGDCQEVLRALPRACVDLVVTDPPYLVSYRDRSGRSIANDDNDRWMYPAFAEVVRVMKPQTYCVSFYGWSKADRFLAVWKECGLYPVGHIVFVKRYRSGKYYLQNQHEQAYLLVKGKPRAPDYPPSDVIPFSYTGNKLHPTEKPVNSLLPLIQAYCPFGGLVLDPFAGCGTTGVAARTSGRKYLLIEKDAHHHRTATERLAAMEAPEVQAKR